MHEAVRGAEGDRDSRNNRRLRTEAGVVLFIYEPPMYTTDRAALLDACRAAPFMNEADRRELTRRVWHMVQKV